jgi:cytidylate kinase
MKAITISRQMGSLGCQVAEETARRLGYRMVWREVINQAALRTGVPEMALATIDELGLLGLRPSETQQNAYLRAVEQVIYELVQEENTVIVGRAGQVILRNALGVLHVRIVAPLVVRIERAAVEMNIAPEAAKKLVEQSDRSRKQYLKRYYNSQIDDPGLYDLIINTERVDILQASAAICAICEGLTNHS